jgi:hypothetical protein
MNEIRAFIGHSFTEDDSLLVGRFLKIFDQVAALHPRFSWQHAEAAEQKLLADKVISLLRDKNLFISICTRKEYVINPSKIKRNCATQPPQWHFRALVAP